MPRRTHRRKHPAAELNITAFMNLMVVLVPFLLMTAVFSHITILDLNLPPPGSKCYGGVIPGHHLDTALPDQLVQNLTHVGLPLAAE